MSINSQPKTTSKKKSGNVFQRFSRSLREFFGFSLPEKFILNNAFNGSVIKFERAFTLAGRDYFWCPDQSEMPVSRGLAALAIYEEMRMGVTKEYIQKHVEEVRALLKGKASLDISRLVRLNDNLGDRAKLMVLPEYIYKLASVVFIEQSESPYSYDWKFNAEKIKLFKEHGDLDFFLSTPLGKLIPLSEQPRGDMQSYFRVAEEIDRQHWSELSAR